MDNYEWPFRLKSARRKKRLQKKDFDKQLIQLSKLQDILSKRKFSLPMIPLEQPYQKGWKRLFVLREDIKRSAKAEFYQTLLDKINTIQYNRDKSFKLKKYQRKRGITNRVQTLKQLDEYDWNNPKLALSENEKECFYRAESWCIKSKRIKVTYALFEPWRYNLVIKPHMIYETKMVDEVLQQEIKELDNYIDNNHLHPRMHRLTVGRKHNSYRRYLVQFKYFNELKNKTRSIINEAYLEQ